MYAPAGLPWQDLALSWLAYDAARATGIGTSYDWLAAAASRTLGTVRPCQERADRAFSQLALLAKYVS